jgi:hypothetical protein
MNETTRSLAVLEQKRTRIRLGDVERRVGAASGFDERRRRVERANVVAALLQVASETSLAAADVERQASGLRQQLEEAIAVESPVRVVSRLTRPACLLGGVALPMLAQRHG